MPWTTDENPRIVIFRFWVLAAIGWLAFCIYEIVTFPHISNYIRDPLYLAFFAAVIVIPPLAVLGLLFGILWAIKPLSPK